MQGRFLKNLSHSSCDELSAQEFYCPSPISSPVQSSSPCDSAKIGESAISCPTRKEMAGTEGYNTVCTSRFYVHVIGLLQTISRLFKNTICRKDGALDPDRTPRMIYREDLTVKYCQFLRLSFADEHALRDDPDAWIEEYLEELASQIELELRAALRYIEVTSEVKGSAEWNEMVHGWRRLIALRHQERELIKQGLDIPLLARQSNASIAQGIWSVP